MTLSFTKMHGLGNDFIVIDASSNPISLSPEQVRLLADRRFGVGCDQLLLVEAPNTPNTEFHYRIFNADGTEVEQCGNGARCFARYVYDKGLTNNREIAVGTAGGRIVLHLENDDQVRIDMGVPRLVPKDIPFDAPIEAISYSLQVDQDTIEIGAVSMGNPHAVLLVDDVRRVPVERLGPIVERHPRFPKHVNVGFMTINARDAIELRVFERGVGETLACGTGACAAVVYGRLRSLLDEQVKVALPGGTLVVSWRGKGHPVWMTGPATVVFEGNVDLNRLVAPQTD